MVTELIRDNRKIVDRVTRDHIQLFVQMLEKHKVKLLVLLWSARTKKKFILNFKSFLVVYE